MKTREETLEDAFDDIWEKHTHSTLGGYGADQTDRQSVIWDLMPFIKEYAQEKAVEFAKEQAIEFLKYLDLFADRSSADLWLSCDGNSLKRYTITELYDKFILRQSTPPKQYNYEQAT